MAINLDFRAPPAFDRSIVPAFMVNFNRIRDAFLHTGMQFSFITGGGIGPWPLTHNILVPYKCDILMWHGVTYWSGIVTQIAMQVKWDGVNIGLLEQWFNEINSHKHLTNVVDVRGVQPGNHTLNIDAFTGGVGSDTNDRWRYAIMFIEVL